ncbi:MAG: extracellular solute-binding protein, partial [Desulfatiglandales bacterium]
MMKSIFYILMIVILFYVSPIQAKEINILVWANATNDERFRTEAIKLAAGILNEELKIEGSDIHVTVEEQRWHGGGSWQKFKQAFSLAIEAGKGPHIVVSGHEDIPIWGRAGQIQPIEELIDLEQWPLSDIHSNLWDVTYWHGTIWGIPQDAESRPFFGWIPHLKAIGYTDDQIESLPGKVLSGEYTLYDVLEDAKKIQDKGLVQKGYGFYPRVSNGPDYWQFYIAFGGEFTTASGNLMLDRQALQQYYQFFHDAVFKYGVTRKNHIGTEWNQWYSEVTSGKAGLWHGGTWHYARYTKKEGLTDFFDKVVFSLIPSGEKGKKGVTITHPLV